jgi:undecaprenyl diphosphate synthase
MDGNGRWAKKKFLPRSMGHRQGVKTVKEIVKASKEIGIKVLSLYAFSTENWKRPQSEIDILFTLLKTYIKESFQEFIDGGVCLRVLGDISKFPQDIRAEIDRTTKESAKNSDLYLNIALNYGARQELIFAFKQLAAEGIKEPTCEDVSDRLYTRGLPDPDLLIRTSGELRISNFLLWQIAYTEIYVTNTLWPDFTKNELIKAVIDFQKRERRFGGL